LAGVLAVLIFAAVLFLESRTFQSVLVKRINQVIPGVLSWEDFSVSVFSGSVHIKNLLLQGQDKKKIAHISRLSVDLSWRNLVSGELCLSLVRAESPVLDLELSQKGELNLLSAVVAPSLDSKQISENPEGSFTIPLNIRITKVVLKNGTIDFKALDQDLSALISGLDLSITELDLASQSASITAKIRQGRIRQKEISAVLSPFSARADFLGETLSNIRVQTALNGVDMDIRGRVENMFTTPVLDVTLNSRLDLNEVKKILKSEVLPTGTADFVLSAKGQFGNPDMDFSISIGPGTVLNQSIDAIVFKSVLRDRVMTILPSRLTSSLGNLFLDGMLDFKEAFPDGFFGEKQDLDQIFFQLNLRQDGTELSCVPGLEKDLKGRLSSIASLKGRGVFPGKITADISADIQAKQLAYQSRHTPLDARILMTADVDGSVFHPQMVLDATAQGLKTDQFPAASLLLKATLDRNGRVHIDRALAEQQGAVVTASGWIDLFGDGVEPESIKPLALGILFENLKIEDIFPDQDLKGIFTGKIDLDGTTVSPVARAVVKGEKIHIKNTWIEDAGAQLAFSNGVVKIVQSGIQNKNSRLDITGQVMLLNPGTLEMATHPKMDLSLAADAVFLEDFFEDMKGKVSLKGRIKGDPDQLAGSLTFAGNRLEIRGQTLEKASAVATLEDKVIQIDDMEVRVAPGSMIKAKGRVRLDDHAFDIRMTTQAFDLSSLNAVPKDMLQSGVLSLDMNVKGKVDTFKDIQASADISRLALSWENQPFLQTKKTMVFYKGGELTLPSAQIDFANSGSLIVKGQGSFNKDLDFEATGSFPFEIISPFVEEIETATGRINMLASLKGTVKDPLVHADLTFDDLAMTMDHLEQEFKNMSGHVRVTPRKIEIVRFTGFLDQGQFDIGGSVGIANGDFQDVDLKFNAHQLTLDIPDVMELTLNSRLALFGTQEKADLTGEIVLLEGRYYRDVDLDLIAATTQRTRKTAPLKEEMKNSFFERIALNVNVSRQESLLVDNNLAYLLVSPDLTIQGTVLTPLLSGRATVDSGTITFHKAEFEVKKGVIDFVNPYKIEPNIEIDGEMTIRTWTITLSVSGTTDNLNLKFSSDPSEAHADIISLIAFGKTTRELGQAQGSGKAASGEIVSGLLADALKKSLKEATGMDQLEIQMNDQNNSGSQNVHVTVGKDLSRQMSVTYGVDTRNGETVQRVTTYYKLLENLMMSGFQDSGGKFGGELKYRLEFR